MFKDIVEQRTTNFQGNIYWLALWPFSMFFTLHAHARSGHVIGGGVDLYILYIFTYMTPKKFEWHFSGRLTFSNTHGRLLVELID